MSLYIGDSPDNPNGHLENWSIEFDTPLIGPGGVPPLSLRSGLNKLFLWPASVLGIRSSYAVVETFFGIGVWLAVGWWLWRKLR